METLEIKKEDAVKAYNAGEEPVKKLLRNLFGEKTFRPQKITDRIKTYEDACEASGIDPDIGISCSKSGVWEEIETINAYAKLIVVARALNEGWQPDWSDSNQYKYFPWFDLSSASGFRFADAYCVGASTGTPARLCYKSRELAEYAGKQFIDLYKEFIN